MSAVTLYAFTEWIIVVNRSPLGIKGFYIYYVLPQNKLITSLNLLLFTLAVRRACKVTW